MKSQTLTLTVPVKVQPVSQKNNIEHLLQAGFNLYRQSDLTQAEKIYYQVLKLNINNSDALHMLGVIYYQKKEYTKALELVDLSIKYNSKNSSSCSNRGLILQELKRYEESLESFDNAIRINPKYSNAFYNRGNVLKELKRYEESLESFKAALRINPNFSDASSNLGVVLQEQKRFDEALESYDNAIKIDSNLSVAFINRGVVLQELKRFDEALESYDKALKINPTSSEVFSNRGSVLQELKRFEESIDSYDKALSIDPKFSEAFSNKSLCLLITGNFQQGLSYYEWRWHSKDFPSPKRSFSKPLWLGNEDIQSKIILIHSEQGLGDTLQFSRYLFLMSNLGAKVYFEVEEKLMRLLSLTFSSICTFIPKGSRLPDFDFHCPLLSLPLAFKTDINSIPSQLSYLTAEEVNVDLWKSRIGSSGFKVGINWQGSQAKIDAGRSFPVSLYKEIAKIPEVRLISLQKGFGTDQLDNIPEGMKVETLGDDFDNGPDAFIDTAAVMKCLDLVITSDTSIAHLAGALGVPTWVALKYVPDWRWLLDRTDSPWYPSVRLFRQKERNNWETVFDEMKHELLQKLSK